VQGDLTLKVLWGLDSPPRLSSPLLSLRRWRRESAATLFVLEKKTHERTNLSRRAR